MARLRILSIDGTANSGAMQSGKEKKMVAETLHVIRLAKLFFHSSLSLSLSLFFVLPFSPCARHLVKVAKAENEL